LGEAIDYVKTELMPDFDFDAFNHDTPYEGEDGQQNAPTSGNDGPEMTLPETKETIVADLNESAVSETTPETAMPETIEDKTPDEINNGTADNGSAEVVEKW
jgi:hypothetical protein